jgi:hypothetical protein
MDTLARTARRRFTLLSLLAVLGLLVFTCGPRIKHYVQLNQYFLNQDYDSALRLIKQNRKAYPMRNAALYHLEKGI